MRSHMSKLAQKLWSDLQPMVVSSEKSEAAQRIIDLFEEAGCVDLYECVQLSDAARVSVLDDEELPPTGTSASLSLFDEFGEMG